MKKLAYILIVIMLFIQGGLLLFFMGTQQSVLKAYIGLKQTRSQSKHLDTFYFSYTTFDSLKIDAKEFRLDKEMYDIEKTIYSKNQVMVIAHKDDFEKKILTIIDGLHDKDPKNTSIPSIIKKIISQTYLIEQTPTLQGFYQITITKSQLFYSETPMKEVFFDVIKPPCIAQV